MKTYHVYIETSKDALDEGGPLAHLPELPGCTARGKTVEATKDAIRQAAQDYVAFRRAQGERGLPDEPRHHVRQQRMDAEKSLAADART